MELALQVALLRGRQLMIEDHQVGLRHFGSGGKLLQFAAADQGCRIGAVTFLQRLSGNHRAGAGGQLGKLFEGFLRGKWNQVFAGIVPGLLSLPGLPRRRGNLSCASGQMLLLGLLRRKLSGLMRAIRGGIRARLLPPFISVTAARTVLDADQEGSFCPGAAPWLDGGAAPRAITMLRTASDDLSLRGCGARRGGSRAAAGRRGRWGGSRSRAKLPALPKMRATGHHYRGNRVFED